MCPNPKRSSQFAHTGVSIITTLRDYIQSAFPADQSDEGFLRRRNVIFSLKCKPKFCFGAASKLGKLFPRFSAGIVDDKSAVSAAPSDGGFLRGRKAILALILTVQLSHPSMHIILIV